MTVFLVGLLGLTAGMQDAQAQDDGVTIIGTITGQLDDTGSFSPFTEYLESNLPGSRFRVRGFATLEEMTQAVQTDTLDFAFMSPAAFVELSMTANPRILATILQRSGDSYSPWLAGAVFSRQSRRDITGLADASGQRVVALSNIALGGWLAAVREWKDLGVAADGDFAALDFRFSYSDIIDAVCNGDADVGVIAANTFAELAGRCPQPLNVLPPPVDTGTVYPLAHSTRLYPEVAFVAVGEHDEAFIHNLALALLGMPAGSAAANAVNIAGFTPPLHYTEVDALLRELRVGPYSDFGALSTRQFLTDNLAMVTLVLLIVFALISAGFLYALFLSRRLRRAENYRKQLFEGSQIAMVVVDAHRRTFYDMNPAAVRLYGYTDKTQLVGKSLMQLTADRQNIDTSISQAFADITSRVFNDGETTFNWRHVRPSGQEWIAKIHLMAFDKNNRQLIQATVEDITEELRHEQERRDLAQQLEFSQRMESMGRLAGGIAHDFNNLLTIINGYCDLLLLDNRDAESSRVIQQISKAGIRASDLTQQLLTFSRRHATRHVPVDLNGIITDCADMSKSLLGDDVQLTLALSGEPCRVMSDPGQLHQVLINLVVNAKDAMPGGGTLNISTTVCDIPPILAANLKLAPGSYVEMKVTDSGIGMDDKIQQHIFEPFFTTKEHSGTGLGLSTVYGIVQQSQGIILVNSSKGVGTTFRVLMPETRETPQEIENTPVGVNAGDSDRYILVVEDQEDVRRYVCSVLEKARYPVMAVGSGAQALSLMESTTDTVGLLLTDVVMDGMSGGELAAIFRERYPAIPVLFTSGYPEDEIARRGVRQGEMAFLAKPFSPGELLDRIAAILRQTAVEP